jgi:hypothetical protein
MLSIERGQKATRRKIGAVEPPDKVVWPSADASRIGAPLAWGIAFAAVGTVFAIIAIVANYGTLNSEGQERLVRIALPSAHYDAIGALISATGEPCVKVCSIRPEPNLAGETRLSVACASSASAHNCATPVRYAISVSRED